MMGPGIYSDQLAKILTELGAHQGILMVVETDKASFCTQLTKEGYFQIPALLRYIAESIEKDLQKNELEKTHENH